MNPQNESNTAGLATAAGLADPASEPAPAQQQQVHANVNPAANVGLGATAASEPADAPVPAAVQAVGDAAHDIERVTANVATGGHAPNPPPVDNDHVAPGAEQFSSAPAPTPQPEPEKPAPTEPPKVTPSPAPSPAPEPAAAESSSASADQVPGPATVDPPAPLIMPTVGRVLLYWPHGIATADGEQPYDAHVVYVHDAHTVNLMTFSHDGFPMPRLRAHLVQPGEPAPVKGGYATWMPFQVGQARALAQHLPAAS